MKAHRKENERLIQAACEGRASDDQIDLLGQLLREDAAVCRDYLEAADAHACLAEDCADITATMIRFPAARRGFRHIGGWIAIAAALVALAVAGVLLRKAPTDAAPDYVAVVINAEGALWEGDDAAVLVGSALEPGLVELCDGRIEMELDNGVHIIMEGPARLELLDENRGILHEGRLSASVPPQAIGFTVATPGMEVVDLGTRFGINVTPGAGPEVHVFDGEVEAIPTNSDDRELLTTSLTRRLDQKSGRLEEVVFNPDRFLPPPQQVIEGVEAIWGDIRALRTPPVSVSGGSYQHNYILLFQEQAHVELEDPLEVSLSLPGQYQVGFDEEDGNHFRQELDAGDLVDSFLLHFDTPSGKPLRCRGSILFDRPVLAVLAGGEQLATTDELLGSWCTTYDRPGNLGRQLERDVVTLSCDRKKLTVNFSVGPSLDQIRILVEAEVPAWKRRLLQADHFE